MDTTIIPQPHFHIYGELSWNIAAPPYGLLALGSIVRGLDSTSLLSPLDKVQATEVPASQLRPIDKPSELNGFNRHLSEFTDTKGNIIWDVIVGGEACAKPSLLRKPILLRKLSRSRKRNHNEMILTVEKLLARYFLATPQYINKALEIDGVASYIKSTKRKKPVYMITGLMWTETAGFQNIGPLPWGYRYSSPFIIGFRVRKIWWLKNGMRCETEDEFGATFDNPSEEDEDSLENAEDGANGATRQLDVDDSSETEVEEEEDES